MDVQISGGPNHQFVCQSAPASVKVLPACSVVYVISATVVGSLKFHS